MRKKKGDEQVYTLELPEGVDVIGSDLSLFDPGFKGYVVDLHLPLSFKGRLVIPEGVRRIDNFCFEWELITAVSFPKSLREIGEQAFQGCSLKELRIEGDGGKIKIETCAFEGNSQLTALTLGNCELSHSAFSGCPINRVTLTAECISPKDDDAFGFGGCYGSRDNFFGTVRDVYGGALGTYALKGKLARTEYKPIQDYDEDGDDPGCSECGGDNICFTLEGFEDDRRKSPVFEWEKVE